MTLRLYWFWGGDDVSHEGWDCRGRGSDWSIRCLLDVNGVRGSMGEGHIANEGEVLVGSKSAFSYW